MQNQQRQLAAILFTDIVGYTALMQENEEKAVALIKHYNAALNQTVNIHNGKILNYYGDGSLCVFHSVIEALNCAIELQKELQTEPTVPLRIGLHVGEVFFEDEKALGDGVNIASRIQSLGTANTILFSKEIFDKIRNHPEFKCVSLGMFHFKNVTDPMEVFALANGGMDIPKREEMSGKLKEFGPKGNTRFKRLIIPGAVFLLLLAATIFIYTQFSNDRVLSGKEKSVAVLPFRNESVDKVKNEPFCNGMMLAVLKNLTWMNQLEPIAAQSVEKYRDSKMSIPDIAKELGGIKYIVVGSVQRNENEVKISASLVNAETGQQIWANDFPGKMENIFSLQEDIAKKIASALRVKISPEEKSRMGRIATKNTKALDAYNEALNSYVGFVYSFHSTYAEEMSLNTQLNADYNKTLAQCDRIMELDSNMSEAYVLKAKTYYYKYSNFESTPDLVDTIRSLCRTALSLNENATDAYVLLSNLLTPNSFADKERKDSSMWYLDKAFSISPNNFEVNWELGKYYAEHSFDPENSIRHFKKALRLDPLSVWTPMVFLNFSNVYRNICDFEKAEYYLKKAIQISTNSSVTASSLFHLGIVNLELGRADSVFKYSGQLLKLNDKNALYQIAEAYCNLKNDCTKAAQLYEELWNKYQNHVNEHRWAIALYKIGKGFRAKQLFDTAFARYKREYPLSYDLAGMYAYRGDKENAYRILKQFDWSWGSPYLVKHDPLFDKVRNDKEFKDLLQKALDEKAKFREKIKKLEDDDKL